MGTYAPLRATLRSAGIAGWAVGTAGAALTFLFGVATGQAQASLELAAAGAAVGALWIGPMVGAAVGAARTVAARDARRMRDAALSAQLGSAAGALLSVAGALALWFIDQAVGRGTADPVAVAVGGAIVGLGVGALCGALVAWYSGRSVAGHTGA